MTRRLTENRIVLASHNAGKLREIGALLAPFGISVVSAAELGLAEPAETEETFAGNARIKAHFAARESGLPALSDDSGITVNGLDGQPGVHTADWAETPEGRDYPMAMAKVWDLLEARQVSEPRHARFVCTLCLAWPDGQDAVFEGAVEGRLVWPIQGSLGFGFDPMFVPSGESQTFGQMDPERKHAISHRAVAFKKFVTTCLEDNV